MLLYNISIALYARLVALVGRWNEKARLWHQGRKNIFERMQQSIKPEDKVVWIHVASLGEFEQGRPIIEQIRKQNLDYKILVTFFSPSGYEIRKNYNGADYIFYLPADTPGNVKRFLDIAHPEVAIFVVVERGGAGADVQFIARQIMDAYITIRGYSDTSEEEMKLLK